MNKVATTSPKYAWRGYMLDVSRHFFTADEVKRTLDLMHEQGLNVFHWHLTDSEGWRLQIDRYPKLTTVGAVRKASARRETTMGLDVVDGDYGPFFYTKDQVRDIVRHAAGLGIRVVPEIEIPGHSAAAIRAYPELGCIGRWNSGEYCLGKESTFAMLENILDEVVDLFPGDVIHIGGDECRAYNWKDCPDCQARMREFGLKDTHDLQGWATKRFADYLEKKGRRLMGWDELATWDDLPRSVIIQSYRGASHGVAAAKKGFDVVMSPDTFCYLDYVQGLEGDPEEYQPFGVLLDVGKIARFDPCADVPDDCRHHILGGQGNLWTELVPDMRAAEWRTWPRLAALADVLWNGPAKDVSAFMAKMQSIRDDLVRRGVNAAPLGPLFKPVPDLLPGARYESVKADNGKRLDFAKMLDNPLDFSVLRFDHDDKADPFRHVFATRDASMARGTYRLDLNFDRISMSAPDDEGFNRGLAQLRALARPKRSGAMEFTGAVIVGDGGILSLNRDRKSVIKTFEENVYGVRPDFPDFRPKACVATEERLAEAGAVRKTAMINTVTPLGETTFTATAYFPEGRGAVPVFVMPDFDHPADEFDHAWQGKMPRWPVDLLLSNGFGTVAFNYNDVLRDDEHVFDGVSRPADGWGAISTWALAASRCADWLETEPLADKARLAVVGLSRLGKTALWAGVTDTRFALVCPTCSGLFGARMATRNLGGETIDQITSKFPHWFAPQCRGNWAGKDWELPFDQHWLLAAVAPRLLAVGSAEDDWWACPSAEFCSWECARQRFWELDAGGNTTYHVRHGGHGLTPEDWREYIAFAQRHGW